MGRREHATAGTTLMVALWLGSSACVQDAPLAERSGQTGRTDSNATVETTKGPLIPLVEGNSWTYSVTKEGKTSTKVLTVEAEEEVGGDGKNSGERAFKIVTTKDDKPDGVSWEALVGKRFVRYREQELSGKTGELKAETSWDPPKLVVDGAGAHGSEGASWAEEYAETVTEDDKTETSDEKDTWSVDAVDEPVTVPAGSFKALVLRRQGGSKAKTFWYVKGIGKVKEDGDSLEELTSYEVGARDEAGKKPDSAADDAADDDDDDDTERPAEGDVDADPAPPEADDNENATTDGDGDSAPSPNEKDEVAP